VASVVGPSVEARVIVNRRFPKRLAPLQLASQRAGLCLLRRRQWPRLFPVSAELDDRNHDREHDEDSGKEPGKRGPVHL